MYRVVKKSGQKEAFEEGKLWNSIYYPARECHYGDERAVDLADEAKGKIMTWMDNHQDNVFTVREIRGKVIEILEEIDEDVAFMYSTHLDLN